MKQKINLVWPKVKIEKIKCDIFNIGRQKPFGHAGENVVSFPDPTLKEGKGSGD